MKTLFVVSAFYSLSLFAAPLLTPEEQNQIRHTFPEFLQRNSEIRSTPLPDYVAWSNNPQATIPSMIRKDFRVMNFAPIPPGGNPGKIYGNDDMAKERADQFAKMDKEPLISVRYGDGQTKLLIISALDCPTAKKLESELLQNEKILNATIYYIPVRLNGTADPVFSNFWCASGDKGSVWLNWWRKGELPPQAARNCQYSYKDSYALWKFFGQKEDGRFTGTAPIIVQEDGTTYAGYPPEKEDFLRMFGGGVGRIADTVVATVEPSRFATKNETTGTAPMQGRNEISTSSASGGTEKPRKTALPQGFSTIENNSGLPGAKQLDSEAQFKIGLTYAQGLGIKKDLDEAVLWYRMAAEQGHVKAQIILGWIYSHARAREYIGWIFPSRDFDTSDDLDQAIEWYRKAAEQGDPVAQLNLSLMSMPCYHKAGERSLQCRETLKSGCEWAKKAADQGNSAAQYNFGLTCSKGEETVQWLLKAAEQGNAAAEYKLGKIYIDGNKDIRKDSIRGIEWIIRAAKRGHPEAIKWIRPPDFNYSAPSQYPQLSEIRGAEWFLREEEKLSRGNLAESTQLRILDIGGIDIRQDTNEAVMWWQKIAEQGSPVAQHMLGNMYKKGSGVKEDLVEAVRWYTRAAEQGDTEAQCDLAQMYFDGKGVQKDEPQAASWLRKAAVQGYAYAQNFLAYIYGKGQGVPKDDTQAFQWYRKAAEQGYAIAQDNLGRMYQDGRGVKKDEIQAVKWYRKAADQGYANAQNNLGIMYENGQGVPKDDAVAFQWYREAAERNSAYGQLNLSRMYLDGRGVEKNRYEADTWMSKAAEQGLASAQNAKGWSYDQDNADAIYKNEDRAIEWYKKAAAQGHKAAQATLETKAYKNKLAAERQREVEAEAWRHIGMESALELGRKTVERAFR